MLTNLRFRLQHFLTPPRRVALRNAALVVLVALPLFWWGMDRRVVARLETEARARMVDHLEIFSNSLEVALHQRLNLVHGLTGFVVEERHEGDHIPEDQFATFAEVIYQGAPGIRNIALAPNGVMSYVYPYEENKAVLGYEPAKDERPYVRAEVQRAIESRKMVISRPYELIQGGLGIIARQAVFINGEYWGLTNLVLDVPPLLEEAGLSPMPEGLQIAIIDQSGTIFYGDSAVLQADPAMVTVSLPEGRWQLVGAPMEGWAASYADQLWPVRLLEAASLILLAIVVYQFSNRHERLRFLVNQRTAQLQTAAEEWRTTFDVMSDMITIQDTECRILRANRAAAETFGHQPQEMLNKFCYQVFHHADNPIEECPFHCSQQSGEIQSIEYWEKTIGKWLHITSNPLKDDQGRVTGVVHVMRDITESKRAQKALQENEQFLNAVFESIQDGISILNPDLTIRYANNVMKEWFPDHLPLEGKYCYTCYHNASEPCDPCPTLRCVQTGNTERDVVPGPPGSSLEWLELYSYPMRDPVSGEVTGIVEFVRDITERKRSEIEIQQLKEFNEGIVQGVAEGITVQDEAGNFTFVNPAIAEMLGYTREELTGQHWTLIVPEDQQAIIQFADDRRAKGEADRYQVELLHKSGERVPVQVSGRPRFEEGRFVGTLAVVTDMRERARVEAERQQLIQDLEHRLNELSAIHLASQELQGLHTPMDLAKATIRILETILGYEHGSVLVVDEATGALIPYTTTEQIEGQYSVEADKTRIQEFDICLGKGITGWVALHGESVRVDDVREDERYIAVRQNVRSELCVPMKVGQKTIGVVNVESPRLAAYSEDDQRVLETVASQIAVALENARLFEETRRRAEETAALLESAQALTRLDLQTVLHTIGQQARSLFQADDCMIFLIEPDGETLRCRLALHPDGELISGVTVALGEGLTGSIAYNSQAEIIPNTVEDSRAVKVPGTNEEPETAMFSPLISRQQTIGVMRVGRQGTDRPFRPTDLELLQGLAAQAAAAIENARLFEETRQRAEEMEALNKIAAALRRADNLEEALPILLDETLAAVGAADGSISLYDPELDRLVTVVGRGWFVPLRDINIRPGEGISGHAFLTGETYIAPDFCRDPQTQHPEQGEIPPGWGGACLPIRAGNASSGVIFVAKPTSQPLSSQQINLLEAIADMAGVTLQRLRLHDETLHRLSQLQTLQSINQTITASMDLNIILDSLLTQLRDQLEVDAAGILLHDPYLQSLEYAAGVGFRTRVYENRKTDVGTGYAGRAVMEHRALHIPDLTQGDKGALQTELITLEEFRAYWALPLIAKGKVHGVLEVFRRKAGGADPGWLDFLNTLAYQAAVAIDNARLYHDLQRANLDLRVAYDATIEGWSRALEYRDQETEGHSQRVTELTMELARAMGMSKEKLSHVHRGALLHDIGKMGIPDEILFKTGELTEEEWELMRQHPQFAHDMLSSIEYLRPALEIPYCHHERWDGTGYPRGLKGEQIPLAARVFAVVDVYDALTNARPYRPAWTHEEAIEHIRQQSGKHFDPQVVETFLKIIERRARRPR